jgi:membrane fusion protein (multidrug efflux system)
MAEAAEKISNVRALREAETAPPAVAATPEPAPRRSRKRLVRWSLLIAGPLLLALGAGTAWLGGGRYVATENAYVQADAASIATDVAGLVSKVEVEDNAPVEAGQILFRLEDSSYRHALAQADANLDLARGDLQALQAAYAQKAAEIARARSDRDFYQKELDRQQELASRRVTAQAALDAARHQRDAAADQIRALEQAQAAIAAQLDGRPDAPTEQHPRYLAALAARDQAARDLEHTVVRAPFAGITAQVSALQPGEYLPAGQAAFMLIAADHVWVEANPKETDLTYVRPGQPVDVTVDTYPGQVWHGVVGSLSPASQSSFSLLPAQNASGNWVKVVQRIPLRVRVDTTDGAPPLRAGMSAEVEIDTGHERQLSDLLGWLG